MTVSDLQTNWLRFAVEEADAQEAVWRWEADNPFPELPLNGSPTDVHREWRCRKNEVQKSVNLHEKQQRSQDAYSAWKQSEAVSIGRDGA